ncbi:SPT3 Dosage dependent suppressor of Ty-induced promoter mutations-like protein [Mortierella alpina]|nr:SPT3 Dosage dependent suppressor of Ty-induced promoter mutations-like protein [Mortierella alpina]
MDHRPFVASLLCRLLSLQIEILGIPAENGKCRVETQLKITLRLADAQGESVKDWKQIRLPHSLIAKEKHRMEKFNGRNKHIQDSEILTLDTRLVCDHDMTKVLECCDNCIGRERKRAHRRKESQKQPGPLGAIPIFGAINPKNGTTSLDNEPVPPTPTDPIEYQAWERRRIMVFSSTEYVDISSGQCLLPTRITCYCRHHNEKVGFRIQFTARDSTGAVVASVLTNAVMMMDDHKSGKKATPAQSKRGEASGIVAAGKKAKAGTTSASAPAGLFSNQNDSDLQELEDEQDDMDQDEAMQEDLDEIDLEAGHHRPQDDFSDIKFEHSELLSGDILTPLSSAADRIGTKRRVDENMMDDIQTQLITDPSRGPSRRKMSHDIAAQGTGESLPYSSTAPFTASTTMESLSSPSPFMPGSPFANDEQSNTFSPSFAQSMTSESSFLDQKNIDMFLQNDLSTAIARRSSSARRPSRDVRDQESSMMEFTTLDESMSSPPDAFQAATLSTDAPSNPVSQALTTSKSAFSIPAPSYPAAAVATLGSSNPFNSTGMLTSAFSTTFSSPLNGLSSTASANPAPGMSSSFLDASQMQEFQNFKRQSILQQKQQQLLVQLQQGVQQQTPQKQMEVMPVPWNAVSSGSKDPFLNMKAAMSQTTSPFSSAFIPVPSSLSGTESSVADSTSTAESSGTGVSTAASSLETPLAPKKRGRPRKIPTKSEAGSPVLALKTAAVPSSPTPPTPTTPVTPAPASATAAAAAAAAAQFLLLQQRQQQQLQHHQQQLQQQQKQAILARQKPRVQKLIPSRGPVEGGIEVTLLGSGFFPGVVLTFDGVPASSVQFYGPETVICRLPPRAFPGTVVVKAYNPMSTPAAPAAAAGASQDDGANGSSSDLVRTISQLFGTPAAGTGHLNSLLDEDVGVLFEYEESKGDHDLIALALQVLGMKMNGRVEPPHQVAMRIMGTAAASNAIMGQQDAGSSSSSSQALQQPHQPQQNLLLGLGGQQVNPLPPNGFQQQLMLQQRQSQPSPQSQQPSQQLALQQAQQQQQQDGALANGSLLGGGMFGFSGFMNPTSGSSGGG